MKRSEGGQRRRDERGRHETAFQGNVPAWCQSIHFIQKTFEQTQPQAILSSDGGEDGGGMGRGWGGQEDKITDSLLIVHHCRGVMFALLSMCFFFNTFTNAKDFLLKTNQIEGFKCTHACSFVLTATRANHRGQFSATAADYGCSTKSEEQLDSP